MLTGESLKEKLKDKDISLSSLSKKLGMSPQALNSRLNTKDLGISFINDIQNATGIILIDEPEISLHTDLGDQLLRYVKESRNKLLSGSATGVPSANSDENKAEKQVIENSQKAGKPYFDELPVSAGRLDTFVQTASPTGYVDLPGVCAQAFFPVVGCSMKPEINPGDVIGVTQIDSWETVDPDKIYLIVTTYDRMIKRLAIDENDNNILWCISNNYPKFKIYKSDIQHIYRVTFCGKLM